MGDDAWFKSTRRTFYFIEKVYLVIAVNVGRTLKMSKISVLYMAVNYEDACEFLTWLIDKTRSYISIVRFDRKRYVLETDKCVVGTFILNHPCRGRALRNSADFFCRAINHLKHD